MQKCQTWQWCWWHATTFSKSSRVNHGHNEQKSHRSMCPFITIRVVRNFILLYFYKHTHIYIYNSAFMALTVLTWIDIFKRKLQDTLNAFFISASRPDESWRKSLPFQFALPGAVLLIRLDCVGNDGEPCSGHAGLAQERPLQWSEKLLRYKSVQELCVCVTSK